MDSSEDQFVADNVRHEFGGSWTQDKLNRVKKYLAAYTLIFERNPAARNFETIYVDAFAGSGYRSESSDSEDKYLFPEWAQQETKEFLKGSAKIALEVEPAFKKYIFVESDKTFVKELENLKNEYPQHKTKINVIQNNSNEFLSQFCAQTDWRKSRAVVFLDPYGMQVEWSVIKALADTKAVDLWILFPLGMAINRLLTKNKPPPEKWAKTLTRFFGAETWREAFYRETKQQTFLDGFSEIVKDADYERISNYFVGRLESVFSKVASNPLPLHNSQKVPLYLLCFAAANPRGAPTAVKIAQHILGGE